MMGYVPCNCGCENDDPRIVMCMACGYEYQDRPSGCPRCADNAALVRLQARLIKNLKSLLGNIIVAYSKSRKEELQALILAAREFTK